MALLHVLPSLFRNNWYTSVIGIHIFPILVYTTMMRCLKIRSVCVLIQLKVDQTSTSLSGFALFHLSDLLKFFVGSVALKWYILYTFGLDLCSSATNYVLSTVVWALMEFGTRAVQLQILNYQRIFIRSVMKHACILGTISSV